MLAVLLRGDFASVPFVSNVSVKQQIDVITYGKKK
jgi:hypothetical protein